MAFSFTLPASASLSALAWTVLLSSTLGILASATYSLCLSPLRRVPGPALARFTRLWELWALRRGGFHQRLVALHEQYGPVVRLAPNRFSFNDVADMNKIYALGGGFEKADFYRSWGDNQRENLLNMRDERKHSRHKRSIAQLYSMTAVVGYEDAVDKMNAVLARRLRDFGRSKQPVQLPKFCQLYAFDVIGRITFDRDFGMMESNRDQTGILRITGQFADYAVQMGLVPELHGPVFSLLTVFGSSIARALTDFSNRAIDDFVQGQPDSNRAGPETFLAKLVALKEKNKVDRGTMMDSVGANINAGSDTTGVTLSAAFYYLYSNPDKLCRLRDEVDAMARDGRASDPVTFAEAQNMPYLQAVIKEVLRMHPAIGVMLPRNVPKGGAELGGYFFPAKTAVGCSAWALHYNSHQVDRPREFTPERWLAKDSGQAASKSSHVASFAFGAGSRVCLGKNISLLEISKVIPQVVRHLDLDICETSGSTMPTESGWFVWPRYTCRVEERRMGRAGAEVGA